MDPGKLRAMGNRTPAGAGRPFAPEDIAFSEADFSGSISNAQTETGVYEGLGATAKDGIMNGSKDSGFESKNS